MTDDSHRPPGLSLSLSSSGRELIIPTANPAREGKDVFVSLSETVAKLHELIAQATAENDRIIFIRAPVAAGKTTLANYLTTKHSDEFVKVASADTRDMWYQHVIDASGENLQIYQVRKALMSIARQRKTIVIDEAHELFSHPNVVSSFFKYMEDTDLAPRFLLFSASGSAADSQGREVTTPSQIQRKYMWYPPNPDADQLSVDLAEAKQPVHLDVDSVRFFVTLCGGHRGIFMRAMKWVQESQKNEPCNDSQKFTKWSIGDSVSQVRKTFEESRLEGGALGWNVGLRKEFKGNRAVRVNGSFSNVQNIPKEFGLVLYGGPKFRNELNNEERRLTINGFLFPERQDTDEEFVMLDWQDTTVSYGVPNPIMAEYYGDILPFAVKNYKRKLVQDKKIPDSAADLLARVLPYMTLTAVVGNPITRDNGTLSSCLSKKGLPYEDEYNGAIAEILKNNLKYMVATPRDEKLGKTDIVVSYDDHSTCAIESIMAWQPPVSFGVCICVSSRSVFLLFLTPLFPLQS